MKIFVIIIHFGDLSITKKCIRSLYQKENTAFSLIVVNNAQEVLVSSSFGAKKHIIVINNKKNLGFAKGANIGIHYALKHKGDYICLLNNDTKMHKPILAILLKELRKDTVGIVGPAIEFEKNGKTLFDIGGKINTLFWRTSHKEAKNIRDFMPQRVAYVSGCCMMMRKEVLEKVGYFDESFFLYYEDADFCLRAKEKGFRVTNVPSAVILHMLSGSAGKMSTFAIFYLVRSGMLFGRKYARGLIQKIVNRTFLLIQVLLFLKANPKAATAIAKALLI